ncbi:Protein N-acetyltransferase, RimJ/RimL family [Halobacillus dabanensis]|uniref:Protein N-acetyltransferase, RimJ/RimL family n=1 Tax=Halobacillus dabanensis TaxID=240302 RepID=A0A1I3YZC6_HALDA|nr:GNAT family protein [Halobacillus dabanensis]SFK37192.1 Protein N-acetyltransferase, RimJ/RimL family [Halobacillus dabanensis]
MLKGNLFELRPVSREDLPYLFKWANDEELATLGHGSASAYQNNNPLEDIEAFYEKNLTAQPLWENGRVFMVYTVSTGVPIGKCHYGSLNPVVRSAEVGISIGEREYWGQGYGHDILNTLLKHLFYTLNLERVQLDTWSGNSQALRLYEKVGFRVEGRLRKNEYVQGAHYDTVLMGILRSEFAK